MQCTQLSTSCRGSQHWAYHYDISQVLTKQKLFLNVVLSVWQTPITNWKTLHPTLSVVVSPLRYGDASLQRALYCWRWWRANWMQQKPERTPGGKPCCSLRLASQRVNGLIFADLFSTLTKSFCCQHDQYDHILQNNKTQKISKAGGWKHVTLQSYWQISRGRMCLGLSVFPSVIKCQTGHRSQKRGKNTAYRLGFCTLMSYSVWTPWNITLKRR